MERKDALAYAICFSAEDWRLISGAARTKAGALCNFIGDYLPNLYIPKADFHVPAYLSTKAEFNKRQTESEPLEGESFEDYRIRFYRMFPAREDYSDNCILEKLEPYDIGQVLSEGPIISLDEASLDVTSILSRKKYGLKLVGKGYGAEITRKTVDSLKRYGENKVKKGLGFFCRQIN